MATHRRPDTPNEAPVRAILKRGVETASLSAIQATYLIDDDCRDLRLADEGLLSFSLGRSTDRVTATYADAWSDGRYGLVGDALFVPPGHRLLSRLSDPRQRVQPTLQLRVRGPLAKAFDRRWDAETLALTLDIRSPKVTEACLRIIDEVSRPGFADIALIEHLAMQAMAELSALFGDAGRKPNRGGLAPWRQRRIVDRVLGDASPPTLAELARYCGLSPRHLTRTFRQQNGCTVGDFVAALRTKKAQHMLSDRALAIGEIAKRLGYASHAGFCTAFLRTTGLRPSEYRTIGPK